MKRRNLIENFLGFFAWTSGLLTSLVVGYGLLNGPLYLPEFFGGHIVSNVVGWAVIITAIVTIILSFFRK